MTEDFSDRPAEEMNYAELQREIEARSRRWNVTVDIPTGMTTAIAYPIERRHPTVTESGRNGEKVLREMSCGSSAAMACRRGYEARVSAIRRRTLWRGYWPASAPSAPPAIP